MPARALRVMAVANDGFSVGHVARTIAIARALARRAGGRGIELRGLLVTTSEAHALLANEAVAIVRLPAPNSARRAGWLDDERRRLARAVVDATVDGFGPDLIVADTFPSGPHGELRAVGRRAKRALIRRSVVDDRHDALTAGLADYDLAIVADDPDRIEPRLAIPTIHVPPITIGEPRDALDRANARAALGLPPGVRAILVAAGGGGDAEAAARAWTIAELVVAIDPDVACVIALGPLADHGQPTRPRSRVLIARAVPIQPLLAAFDGAFSPAGYNTAHELAKARVPAALFAQPRPFDDQAGRAARFARAGFATTLDRFDADSVATALAWMTSARCPELATGGADRAADALLDLAAGLVADRRAD